MVVYLFMILLLAIQLIYFFYIFRNITKDAFVKYLKISLYNSPWFKVEIASHQKPNTTADDPTAGNAKSSNITITKYKPTPFEPFRPIEWKNVGEDEEKFISSYSKFYEFPLPGGSW